jgi:hypothetical protein
LKIARTLGIEDHTSFVAIHSEYTSHAGTDIYISLTVVVSHVITRVTITGVALLVRGSCIVTSGARRHARHGCNLTVSFTQGTSGSTSRRVEVTLGTVLTFNSTGVSDEFSAFTGVARGLIGEIVVLAILTLHASSTIRVGVVTTTTRATRGLSSVSGDLTILADCARSGGRVGGVFTWRAVHTFCLSDGFTSPAGSALLTDEVQLSEILASWAIFASSSAEGVSVLTRCTFSTFRRTQIGGLTTLRAVFAADGVEQALEFACRARITVELLRKVLEGARLAVAADRLTGLCVEETRLARETIRSAVQVHVLADGTRVAGRGRFINGREGTKRTERAELRVRLVGVPTGNANVASSGAVDVLSATRGARVAFKTASTIVEFARIAGRAFHGVVRVRDSSHTTFSTGSHGAVRVVLTRLARFALALVNLVLVRPRCAFRALSRAGIQRESPDIDLSVVSSLNLTTTQTSSLLRVTLVFPGGALSTLGHFGCISKSPLGARLTRFGVRLDNSFTNDAPRARGGSVGIGILPGNTPSAGCGGRRS